MSSESPAPAFDLKAFVTTVTQKPGVYIMYNADGEVLYVGKAKNLRNRLSSYSRAAGLTTKTIALVSRIVRIDVTVTDSETEALLLEQNLIKQYHPPYNVLLKDDKSYPYIHLSDHESPRLSLHRGSKRRGGRYCGPYPSAGAVRESLSLLEKVFQVRQCEDSYFSHRSRPCLQHQIGRCSAPCVGAIDPRDYARDIERTVLFLDGKSDAVVNDMAAQMETAAATYDYERAALFRDRIRQLQQVQASQYIEGETGDLDLLSLVGASGAHCVQMLCVRKGRVLGSRTYYPRSSLDESDGEVMESFIAQHYLNADAAAMPGGLIVNVALPDTDWLQRALSERLGRKLKIVHRVRGERARWQQLATQTATQNLQSRLRAKASLQRQYGALQKILELDEAPGRMECFDISHSSGEATVASCVVFDQNGPQKASYRRFNIDGIEPGDDYAAMKQALTRRYKRIKSGEFQSPDILFIDGGKGQLKQAKEVFEELQVQNILLVAVAKGSDRRAGQEILIRGDTGREQILPGDSPALHLIQQIRDESHRFAIAGHKGRRDKARRQSTLESIPGVGSKRRRELLRYFGGAQGVARASIEDLCRVPGVNQSTAEAIYAAYHSA